jgi:hypothetical protein
MPSKYENGQVTESALDRECLFSRLHPASVPKTLAGPKHTKGAMHHASFGLYFLVLCNATSDGSKRDFSKWKFVVFLRNVARPSGGYLSMIETWLLL